MGVATISNSAIADALDELGDLYELDGAVIHRVLAYRTAAKVVRDAPVSVAALTREGRVTELPGIGATLEQKIRDLIETGEIPAAVKLRARFPAGLLAITGLPGPRPQARAPAVRRARHRLAAGAARGGASSSACGRCAASARSSRSRCSPRSTPARPSARAAASCSTERSRSARC